MNKDNFLEKGDVIELTSGMKVYANVPEHFVYSNKRGSFALTHTGIRLGEEFDYLCGKYIVTRTAYDGGGTGMGSNDVFPNGYHVFCVKADDRTIEVDFYQSGCFTAMIKDIIPIGKARLTWTI